MAAYAATVTLTTPHVNKVGGSPVGLLLGTVDITNYNQTLAELTGITGAFRGTPMVVPHGVSSNGYLVKWDATGKAFKCYYPVAAHAHNLRVIGGRAEGTTDIINAANAAATLGKEEATNLDILGADSVTKGGVMASTAIAGAEVANDVNIGTVQFLAVGVAT